MLFVALLFSQSRAATEDDYMHDPCTVMHVLELLIPPSKYGDASVWG